MDTTRQAYLSTPAVLLLALITAAGTAAQRVFSPMQELVKTQMSLSDFQLSLVQGLATALPIVVFSIPVGRMVERANRVRLLLAMELAGSLGVLLTGFASSFQILFFARALAAIGAICSLPVAISIAADLSPPERRGLAQTLLFVGKLLGSTLAFALGGALVGALNAHPGAPIADLAPWRGVQFVFAGGSILLILPLLWLSEPSRREVGTVIYPSIAEAASVIWQRRALLAPLFLGEIAVSMADAAASIWASPVLVRNYHQQPQQFGSWMGLMFLLSGLVGTVVGGLLADLGHKGNITGGIMGGAVIGSLLSVLAAFFPVMPTETGFALMLSLLMIGGSVASLGMTTTLTVLLPNKLRGVCLGAFMVSGALLSLGIAPTLVTLFSTALGGEDYLGEALTIVGALSSVVAVAGFIMAQRAARNLGWGAVP